MQYHFIISETFCVLRLKQRNLNTRRDLLLLLLFK